MCWEEGETIEVLCDNQTSVTYTLSDGAGTANGTFTGDPKDANPLYAVSSLGNGSDLTISDGCLTFTLPQEINAAAVPAARSFASVAQVSGNSVGLRNIMGLLRVDFLGTASNIKKIVLHDLAGNDLCGTCRVPINDGSLQYEKATVSGGGNTLALKFDKGQDLAGKSYYFPIPVGALDGGFSIVLYEADDTKTDGVGRAYSFMQKISGTKPMPRSGLLYIKATVSEKPEPFSVKERGYYKSLFVNAGVGLDGFRPGNAESGIPAIEYMGLDEDFEYINLSDTDTQTGIIIENEDDANGVLLYPDGSPRFRLIFNRGGSSVSHGQSLGEKGRGRFKTFFENGGSYSGVCAGAFLAAESVSDAESGAGDFTFHLIPVTLTHTSLPKPMSKYRVIYTNMEILEKANKIIEQLKKNEDDNTFSELLGQGKDPFYYYTESGKNVGIKDVMHHGGGYLPSTQLPIYGVETLMKFKYSEATKATVENPDVVPKDDKHPEDNFTNFEHYYTWENRDLNLFGNSERDGEFSTWAYKKNNNTGRAVCTGSHPEVPGRVCDVQFTGFMFRYAMEGNGEAIIKSDDLTLGQTRYMNQLPSSYADPAANDAGIGDGQYHHFKFESPGTGIDNFVLRLDSACDKDSGIDLYLGLRKQKSTDKTDLAWLSEADYALCNKGGQKEIRIKHLPEGTWYVSVYCATKVTVEENVNKYFEYVGNKQVLNGVPYSISIAQDGTAKDFFPSTFGGGDDFADSMDD